MYILCTLQCIVLCTLFINTSNSIINTDHSWIFTCICICGGHQWMLHIIKQQCTGGVLRTPFTSCGLGPWFMRPAMLTLPWQNIINIQTHMCSKYKYDCIVHANTNQFTICGLGRRFMGPDMLTLPWQKSNGSIRVHKNTNTWKPKEKQLLLQIQIMHCPVELLLLQNSVGWIRCIVVLD